MSLAPLDPQTPPEAKGAFSPFDRTVLATAAIVLALVGLLIWRSDQTGTAEGMRAAAAQGEAGPGGNLQPAEVQGLGPARSPYVLFTTVVDGAEQLFSVAWPGVPPGSPATAPGGAAPEAPALPTPTMLTQGDGQGGGSVWDYTLAPDGSRIVFSALNAAGGSDLWVVETGANSGEGSPGAPELLLACPNAFCATPAWSPDGRLLAYSQRNANDFAAAAVSPPRLFLLDVQSGEAAPVFADSQKLGFEPRWSVDGQWLAYLSPDFYGVTAFNVQTGAEVFFPTQTGETGVWHPQRSEFLMSEQAQIGDTHVVHLYLVDPIANTRRNLSGESSLVEDGSPAWSPDGEWIAFRRTVVAGEGRTLSKQLWLMRPDGSEARALTADAEIDYGAPDWSADGRTLLYHRFPLKGPNIVIAVWAMDLATGAQVVVARPGQRPQWGR
jgi:TolB protein